MKIFITGSTTGLGELAGEKLLALGHEVIFHARSEKSHRKPHRTYVFGDLTQPNEIHLMAQTLNQMGKIDSVIHNAGVYTSPPQELFTVNVLAPYLLCALMNPCDRYIFLSSGLHLSGTFNLNPETSNYSDTKLSVTMLGNYLARKWPRAFCNSVNPGWVPTRMGGAGAPDDLQLGAETQAWLATSTEAKALVSGAYFFHKEITPSHALSQDIELQNHLVEELQKISGVKLR